jgi:hypothetical protein
MATNNKTDTTSFFDDLMAGFQELRQWAKGEKELRTTAIRVTCRAIPVRRKRVYSPDNTLLYVKSRKKVVRISPMRKVRVLRHTKTVQSNSVE